MRLQPLHLAMMGMAVASLLGAIGQIALKSANVQFNVSAIANWRLWAFFACYGAGVVINVVAYRYGPVSLLYPIISFSYIFSMILAAWLLHEPVSAMKLTGAMVIVAGVAIITLG